MLLGHGFRLVRLCVAGVAGLLFMSFGSVALALDFDYTARLGGVTARTGAVVADGITWQCAGDTCTARGPWPLPGIRSCAALAREVGQTILSYGHPGAQLRAPGLASCNQRARAGLQRGPFTHVPSSVPQSPPQEGVVTAPEMFIVGGAYTPPPSDVGPQRVAAPEMSIVGGAYTPPGGDIAPQTVNAPEMSIIGGSTLPDLRRGPTPQTPPPSN